MRAVEVEVIHQCIQVHLHHRLMVLALQQLGNLLEGKYTCTLEEDGLVSEQRGIEGIDEVLRRRMECSLKVAEALAAPLQSRTDTHKAGDASRSNEGRHL